jgi:CHAT domain-containing protein
LFARLGALRRILVPDDAWRRIRSAPEVVVVPGRGLYLLPFEALVAERGATPAATRFWLDDGPAVRYAASAATLYNLELQPTVADGGAGAGAVLSLSRPVFDPAELLQAEAPRRRATPAGLTTRAGFLAGGGGLPPLPGTAAETEAIRRAFSTGPSGSGVTVLQGSDATEAGLRDALAGKRYVHLATHALVDEQRSSLFAALALTPPTTDRPSAENDGFLQLHEIYQLRLPDLALAVLSACETNAGPAVDGEGVFALSRGFHAAGARRVVGSEWAVEDRSTAALMGAFFGEIATVERSPAGGGVDYARALRDAKRAVRREPRWAHPYYWAPFVLTGTR